MSFKNRAKNIRTKLVTDQELINYFESKIKIDNENTAGLDADTIRSYGYCHIPKKIYDGALYQSVIIPARFRRKYNINARMFLNHRVSYKIAYPSKDLANMTIDHAVCQNPQCCNANHLRILTLSENTAERGSRAIDTLKKQLDYIQDDKTQFDNINLELDLNENENEKKECEFIEAMLQA
tara:strand:+ start:6253 stop:6795 length:543 start_codon:yes stop_codon:yes gene_type:complete